MSNYCSATQVTQNTTQDGGVYVNVYTQLKISHDSNNPPFGPLLTLTNGATTAGIQQVYVGDGSGSKGRLLINGGSVLTNSDQGPPFLDSGYGFIGYYGGSSGEATVTGAGSSWINTGEFNVGYIGNGKLFVTAGGTVSNTDGFVGYFLQSTSEATVSGANSAWNNNGRIHVGYMGNGKLRIEDSGTVTTNHGIIGNRNGASGEVTVTGANSKWISSGDLTVSTQGKLLVEAGGSVSNVFGRIGIWPGSSVATITGAGSTWSNSNSLTVGDYSGGELYVQNGGLVSSAFGYLGVRPNVTGTVTIGGAGSKWAAGELYIGGDGNGTAGSGLLKVETGGIVDVSDTLRVWNSGQLKLNGGMLKVHHFNPSPGTFTISSGTLAFSGNVTGSLTVPTNGIIAGTGTVLGSVSNQGRIAPGSSDNIALATGLMTIDSSLNSTGVLAFELASPSSYDRLNVGGAVTLNGSLEVGLAGGYLPTVGDTFNLLDFGSLSLGSNFAFNFAGPAGLVWDTSSFATDGSISVLAAPLAGDLNNDGFVGQDDLNAILNTWGQTVTTGSWTLGDPSGDGFVGQDDLNRVLSTWGQGTPPSVTPVPEPATFLLMGLAGIGLLAMRCRLRRAK
ncbi:MAG: PEP-CTERM sorting domain-containing protein [Planctomycetota bacterium]|nr:PEP-CTERM sorting domain-containing protein [Planctomycetota bacterium]